MSTDPYTFRVDPGEDFETWATRWDKGLAELHSRGLTIVGKDADNDEPLRIELEDETHPEGPYFEVYGTEALA